MEELMFSVNIDKLIVASDDQKAAYRKLADNLLMKGRKYKSVALIGTNGFGLRLAVTLSEDDNKVLFVDGDMSTSIFMGKYRLGKNLQGISECLDGTQVLEKVACITNYPNLKMVFSGDKVKTHLTEMEERKLRKLIENCEGEYDYVIVEAGNNVDVARNCLSSIALIQNDNYSPEYARKIIEEYDNEGCLVLGVTIINA